MPAEKIWYVFFRIFVPISLTWCGVLATLKRFRSTASSRHQLSANRLLGTGLKSAGIRG